VDRAKLTNPLEILAFALSQVIKIGVNAALVRVALAPLYSQLLRTGGAMLIFPISIAFGALLWFAALPLFILLRMLFGGVPPVVAASGREDAFTSSGAEIGAYALAYVIEAVLFSAATWLGLTRIYTSLRASGHATMILPVSLVIAALFAAIFFLIFIGLRRAFAGPAAAIPGGAVTLDTAGGGEPDVGFGGAIARCFQKYAIFRGRARRPEYWYWVLFSVLLGIPTTILDLLMVVARVPPFIGLLATLGLFLPGLAVSVRRLHDRDRSGWFVLLSLIPLIGPIILIIMFCQRGTAGPNRFGPA